jgi:hypothetical protein
MAENIDMIETVPRFITILGFLMIIVGIHKVYCAVKPDSKTYIVDPGREPFEGAVIDFKVARQGIRFVVYGFLIQVLQLML